MQQRQVAACAAAGGELSEGRAGDAPHPLLLLKIVTRTHFSRTRSPSCGARIDSNPMVISALIGAITADIGAAIAIGIDGCTAVADASNGDCRVKRM